MNNIPAHTIPILKKARRQAPVKGDSALAQRMVREQAMRMLPKAKK